MKIESSEYSDYLQLYLLIIGFWKNVSLVYEYQKIMNKNGIPFQMISLLVYLNKLRIEEFLFLWLWSSFGVDAVFAEFLFSEDQQPLDELVVCPPPVRREMFSQNLRKDDC